MPDLHHQGTRQPGAYQPRSRLLAIKALRVTKRTVLGDHVASVPRTYKGRLDRPLLGEPRSFMAVVAPTSIMQRQTASGWNRVKMHKFKRVLHTRRPRRVSIGGWRRSARVLKPR